MWTSGCITETFQHLVSSYLVINHTLHVTVEHPLFVNGAWRAAGQVQVGDTLLDVNGQAQPVQDVLVVQTAETAIRVYNLHMADEPHNYFAAGILVHNKEAEPMGIMRASSAGPDLAALFARTSQAPSVTVYLGDEDITQLIAVRIAANPVFERSLSEMLRRKGNRSMSTANTEP